MKLKKDAGCIVGEENSLKFILNAGDGQMGQNGSDGLPGDPGVTPKFGEKYFVSMILKKLDFSPFKRQQKFSVVHAKKNVNDVTVMMHAGIAHLVVDIIMAMTVLYKVPTVGMAEMVEMERNQEILVFSR